MYQKYRVCVSNFQNVRMRVVFSAAKIIAPGQVFRSQNSPPRVSPRPKSPAQGFSVAKVVRPGFFHGQNSPPKVFSVAKEVSLDVASSEVQQQ